MLPGNSVAEGPTAHSVEEGVFGAFLTLGGLDESEFSFFGLDLLLLFVFDRGLSSVTSLLFFGDFGGASEIVGSDAMEALILLQPSLILGDGDSKDSKDCDAGDGEMSCGCCCCCCFFLLPLAVSPVCAVCAVCTLAMEIVDGDMLREIVSRDSPRTGER